MQRRHLHDGQHARLTAPHPQPRGPVRVTPPHPISNFDTPPPAATPPDASNPQSPVRQHHRVAEKCFRPDRRQERPLPPSDDFFQRPMMLAALSNSGPSPPLSTCRTCSLSARYASALSGLQFRTVLQLSIRSASLIVFASTGAFASLSRSFALAAGPPSFEGSVSQFDVAGDNLPECHAQIVHRAGGILDHIVQPGCGNHGNRAARLRHQVRDRRQVHGIWKLRPLMTLSNGGMRAGRIRRARSTSRMSSSTLSGEGQIGRHRRHRDFLGHHGWKRRPQAQVPTRCQEQPISFRPTCR